MCRALLGPPESLISAEQSRCSDGPTLILQVVAGYLRPTFPHTSLWLSGLYFRAIKSKTPSDTTWEPQKII